MAKHGKHFTDNEDRKETPDMDTRITPHPRLRIAMVPRNEVYESQSGEMLLHDDGTLGQRITLCKLTLPCRPVIFPIKDLRDGPNRSGRSRS